ncbi:MAG: dephospho-CoA kinase [Flavobacteriales bacterium]|jgi:dephospho-CoA kinase|nr:dephospho-CoA kinase [Flavobacteriales bacterium]MDG1174978.1 dephospho-CoA kinase [Flavobacteriales bacterium]
MRIIGITGGIGSGKSTIAKVFISMGFPVYNSDTRAKELINSNIDVIDSIKQEFGDDIYSSEGLDRKKMASIVFSDSDKLQKLNSIVHPAVGLDFDKWANSQNTSFVLKEAAILFETGIYKSLDKTILVTCPKEERINRVMKRDSATKEAIEARMNSQWSEEKKKELADYIIDNSGEEMVIPQVISLINRLSN